MAMDLRIVIHGRTFDENDKIHRRLGPFRVIRAWAIWSYKVVSSYVQIDEVPLKFTNR